MFEVISAFVGCEGVEELSDALPEGVDGSLGGLSEQGLEFGEGELNRVEIGRVRRQEEERRAARLDELTDLVSLVAAEVVEDDDVARGQRRGEDALLVLRGEKI